LLARHRRPEIRGPGCRRFIRHASHACDGVAQSAGRR
jgi:hypothetical protein